MKLFFNEASGLNLIGKISDGTTNPYHRVDTTKYKGFTKHENQQVRYPAGIAVLFKTNSNIAENLEEVWHRITKDSPSYSKQGSSEISRLPCLILWLVYSHIYCKPYYDNRILGLYKNSPTYVSFVKKLASSNLANVLTCNTLLQKWLNPTDFWCKNMETAL